MKDKIQRKGLNLWFAAGCRGTLEYATGVGKSRCGVLAAGWLTKLNPDANILVLTPTQTIRDQAWKEEFGKWGATAIFDNNVECLCIQSAYKLKEKHYDLVIADEIHNYIPVTDEYMYFKFFENNTMDRLLGLSASIDKALLPRLNTVAPIVDTINTNQAVELGLVSPFRIFNIPIELSMIEKLDYDKHDKEFKKTFTLFDNDLNLMFRCLKTKSVFKQHLIRSFSLQNASKKDIGEVMNKYKSYPHRCNSAMKKRKEVIYHTAGKLEVIEALCELFGKRYGVIFSQTAAFADMIGELLGEECVVEHSKIKPPKRRKKNIDAFQDGTTDVHWISAVKSLNEGANLNRVRFIIIGAGTSKIKDFIQRMGRSIRWEDGKLALIIRLYAKDTQEEKWVKSSQDGYEVSNLFNYKDLCNYVEIRVE